eukprot:2098184-Rhodomonas_salina.2
MEQLRCDSEGNVRCKKGSEREKAEERHGRRGASCGIPKKVRAAQVGIFLSGNSYPGTTNAIIRLFMLRVSARVPLGHDLWVRVRGRDHLNSLINEFGGTRSNNRQRHRKLECQCQQQPEDRDSENLVNVMRLDSVRQRHRRQCRHQPKLILNVECRVRRRDLNPALQPEARDASPPGNAGTCHCHSPCQSLSAAAGPGTRVPGGTRQFRAVAGQRTRSP